MKAILIDSAAREVREIEYTGYRDISAAVGGYIEVAWQGPGGDVLYVNEEGLLKPLPGWFNWPGRPDLPLNGNAILVGREIGDSDRTEDPHMTVGDVRALVQFLSDDQVKAWARANASDAGATITTWGKDGQTHTTRLSSLGEMFNVKPGDKSCATSARSLATSVWTPG